MTLGCRHRLDPVNGDDMEVQIQSTFDPDAASASAPSKATSTTFQNGDKVGLYMVNYNGANPVPLTSTGCQEDNVLFTSNQGGVLIANPPVRYKKDYKGKLDLYAYYPYDADMQTKNVNAYEFAVQQDQSKGITTSDFCRTKTDPSIVPTSNAVPLTFKHMLSKIWLTLNLPREYKDGLKIDSIIQCSFMGVTSDVTVNIGAGTLTNGTKVLTRLSPYILQVGVVEDDESLNRAYELEMIAPAQTYAVGKQFLEVVVQFENGSRQVMEYVVETGLFGDNSTKAGKKHHLSFSVSPGLELSFKGVTITDWLTGTETVGEVDAAITTKFSVGRQDFEPTFDGANRVRVLTDDSTVYDIQTGVTIAGGKCEFSFTPESGAPRDYGFRIVELEFLRNNTSLYKRQFISPRVYDPVTMDLGLLPFSGAGSEGDPYLIATAADLDNVRLLQGTAGRGKFFRQTADIDLAPYLPIKFVSAAADGSTITFAENVKATRKLPYIGNRKIGDASGAPIDGTTLQGGWVPIGHNANGTGTLPAPITDYEFYGNYDGAGYAISNLMINRSVNDGYNGLFTVVVGALKNIILKTPYINSGRTAGALSAAVLCVDATTQTSGSAIMCEVQGGVVRAMFMTEAYCGGLFGLSDDGSIVRGCMNSATVYSEGSVVGGISGANTGTIEGCLNMGSVKGLRSNIGGVTGLATRNGVTSYSYNRGNFAGAAAVNSGAIIGGNIEVSIASNCYWLSTATYTNCGPNGYGTNTFAGSVSGFAALTAADMQNRNQNDPTGLLYKLNQGAVKWQIAPAGHWNAGWPIPASIGEPERPRLAGVANCYMMQPGSTIAFDATARKAYFSTPNAAIGSVKILWQTARNHGTTGGAANMILNASALSFDATKGIVSVTANSGAGNAVVAAYSGANGTGDILWSWHIWVTPKPASSAALPAANQAAAGGAGKLFMDRNLGAITANVGNVGAYGMLYQWGRKDPFTPSLGMTATSISLGAVTIFDAAGVALDNPALGISSTTGFKHVATSNNNNLVDAIKNPMTHYLNSDNNWTLNGASDKYWRAPATALATAGYVDNRGDKGVYDPCPVGYRIAANGAYAGFPATGWTQWNSNGGISWLGVWWPAVGGRTSSDGIFLSSGFSGFVWSSSPQSATTGNHLYYEWNNGATPNHNSNRSYGFSVRCVNE